MADLSTTYLKIPLRSPLIVAACPLSDELANIRRMEDAGAAAVVLYSLFEEQIELAELGYKDYYVTHQAELPEALRHVADMEEYSHGAGAYLAHVYQAKQAVDIPVIGSLNGYYSSGWVRYARLIEAAGADALELNIYYLATKAHVSGAEVEQMYVDLVRSVSQSVHIPVAVKLSPYFSSTTNIARRIAAAGAGGLVLFNRFYQPDIDIELEAITPSLDLSTPAELRLRLRWVALLAGGISADLAVTGGVHSAVDVIKCTLAGASATMMASALIANGIDYLATVETGLHAWLESHDHATLSALRGKLSLQQSGDSAALERANYMRVLRSGLVE